VQPAHEIHLDTGELAQLGSLAVIMGQVDNSFYDVVQHLLGVNRTTVRVLMKSREADVWAAVIRSHCPNEELLPLVEHCIATRNEVSADRNDFVHGVYGIRQFGGFVSVGLGTGQTTRMGGVLMKTARRASGDQERPVSDLAGIVERASRLSCLVAHVGHIAMGGQPAESPWVNRLEPALAELRRVKTLDGSRRSS
jgi:hypothetical protein